MKPVVLVVLDGFGLAPPGPGNPISLANPTNITTILHSFPNTTLTTSGEAVGLPPHEVGNTEVGHINLGAGRIIYQDLPRINMNIADGGFYKNKVFLEGIDHIKKTGGSLHLIGLLGEGNVHSSVEHLYALLYFAREHRIENVFIHGITDGRDSPPKSATETVVRLEGKLTQLGVGKIATIMGRYYAMDRDRRWERIEKAYICLTKGSSITAPSAIEAVLQSYQKNQTDEFIEPTIIIKSGAPAGLIKKGDTVIFYNFRVDRPRELTKAFVLENFAQTANQSFAFDPYAVKYYKTHFPQEQIVTPPFIREAKIPDLFFITITEYEKGLPVHVAYPPLTIDNSLGRVVADHQLKQLRMAESEKERFVTFYFNGQHEDPFALEDRLIVPSPKVPTYDLKPEMSAYELTELLISQMIKQEYSFILVNYANADMVGHTGNIEASMKAVKALDDCVGKVIQTALNAETTVLITSDHGNVEQKINHTTGRVSTEHTANLVPFVAVNKIFQGKNLKLQSGILADVAPTVLELMGIPKPPEMTGRNLLADLR